MIKVGNFIYIQDDKLNWAFKAKENDLFDPKKNLRPKYSETPQYDIIYDIDAHMRGQMNNEVKSAVKEILELLKP